jgi:hypothetical protein
MQPRQHRARARIAAVPAMACLALAIAGCSATPTGKPAAHARHAGTGTKGRAHNSTSAGRTSPTLTSAISCPVSGGVRVATGPAFQAALDAAHPGETIVLAQGVYQGNFVASASGSSAAPITVCGSRQAVLDGGDRSSGYVLHLASASWWRLAGFTVENGQKGVVLDGSSHDLLYGLYVHSVGDEAIHLRDFSSHDVVSHCKVRATGLHTERFGEGIYVGSAHKNWCRYSACQPDASNFNTIVGNNIANTTAENIDIKEGTTGGTITGNYLNGAGMVASAATAWINVKGSDWTISRNIGINSIGDGFQVHQVYAGWGTGNVFTGNHALVHGPGFGIYVESSDLRTVVACNNTAAGAGSGLSNIHCASA